MVFIKLLVYLIKGPPGRPSPQGPRAGPGGPRFYYYGSSLNLGERLKYHYYTSPKDLYKLGFFLKTTKWENFSVSIIELCDPKDLINRENYYLQKYRPRGRSEAPPPGSKALKIKIFI